MSDFNNLFSNPVGQFNGVVNPSIPETVSRLAGNPGTPESGFAFADHSHELESGNLIGPASSRPASGYFTGQQYFDTTRWQLFIWNAGAWQGTKSKALDAQGSTVGGITTTNTTVCSITVADQGCNGRIYFWGHLLNAGSVNTDQFEVGIFLGGTEIVGSRPVISAGGAISLVGSQTQATGVSTTFNMMVQRIGGSGGFNSFADYRYNRMQTLFIPD